MTVHMSEHPLLEQASKNECTTYHLQFGIIIMKSHTCMYECAYRMDDTMLFVVYIHNRSQDSNFVCVHVQRIENEHMYTYVI